MARQTLICLVYGGEEYARQATFSILSARHFGRQSRSTTVVVYTDSPSCMADVDVVTREVSDQAMTDWAGPHGFALRRKQLALEDAAQQFGGKLLFVDTDTFFQADPQRLFDAISETRSVMDVCEGMAGDPIDQWLADNGHAVERLTGRPAPAVSDVRMWNSGVIGLDACHAPAIHASIDLCDAIYAAVPHFTIEQFAVGFCLAQRTVLRDAGGAVYHYCHPVMKKSFARRYLAFYERYGHASEGERAARCMAFVPRWDLYNTSKIVAKKGLKAVGLWQKPLRFDLT
jgi:hypothetical protein